MRNKVISTIVLLFAFSLVCLGQKQRMAILPSSMNYGGGGTGSVKAICIDSGRGGPSSGDIYKSAISNDISDSKYVSDLNNSYEIEGISSEQLRIKSKGGGSYSLNNSKPIIVGETNEPIHPRYLEFINAKIEEYANKFKKTSYDTERQKLHYQLQDEIWNFDRLNELGYIKGDGKNFQDFENAKKQFETDWGVYDWNCSLYLCGKAYTLAENLAKLQYQVKKINEKEQKNFISYLLTKAKTEGYLSVQKEISGFLSSSEALNSLGYFKGEGRILDDFSNAKKQFENDWGVSGWDYYGQANLLAYDLLDIQTQVKKINENEKEFKSFLVAKTEAGKFVLFYEDAKGLNRIIVNKPSELADYYAKNLKSNEHVLQFSHNFEDNEKAEITATEVRRNLETNESNKNNISVSQIPISNYRDINNFLSYEKYPNSFSVLLSSNFEHKLKEPLSKDNIKPVNVGEKTYYATEFGLISKSIIERYNREYPSQVEMQANGKVILEQAVEKFGVIKDFTKGKLISLFRNILNSMTIKREDAFKFSLKIDNKKTTLSKKAGEDKIYFEVE